MFNSKLNKLIKVRETTNSFLTKIEKSINTISEAFIEDLKRRYAIKEAANIYAILFEYYSINFNSSSKDNNFNNRNFKKVINKKGSQANARPTLHRTAHPAPHRLPYTAVSTLHRTAYPAPHRLLCTAPPTLHRTVYPALHSLPCTA